MRYLFTPHDLKGRSLSPKCCCPSISTCPNPIPLLKKTKIVPLLYLCSKYLLHAYYGASPLQVLVIMTSWSLQSGEEDNITLKWQGAVGYNGRTGRGTYMLSGDGGRQGNPFENFFFLSFLGPHPRHMEVPRLELQSELQLPAYNITTVS